MRRIALGGIAFALLGAAVGYTIGHWGVTRLMAVQFEVWQNRIQLTLLKCFLSNDVDCAIRVSESQLKGQAIVLGLWLEEGEARTEFDSEAACTLQKIQEYLRNYPPTFSDPAYDAEVTDALAYSVGCGDHEARPAAAVPGEFGFGATRDDTTEPRPQGAVPE